jgi:hypothetical protein
MHGTPFCFSNNNPKHVLQGAWQNQGNLLHTEHRAARKDVDQSNDPGEFPD